MPKKEFGFTLVELLVVATIIAIFSVVGTGFYQQAQQQARITKVRQDLEAMSKEIQLVRETKNATFYDLIGGDDYPDRNCRQGTGGYLPDTQIKDRPDCISEIEGDWANFTQMQLPTDPWGNIYTYDANEMEPNFFWENNTPGIGPRRFCRWDILKSAGPDGVSWTDDDYIYYVPPKTCKIKEECYVTPGIVMRGRRNNPLDVNECTDPNAP